jgi:DNA-binding CsgD family transcriptional regulator
LVLAARGQWVEAQAHTEQAQAAATALGDRASLAYASNAAVHLASCRGDAPAVISAVQPLLEAPVGSATHEPGVLGWRSQYAEALVALGRHADAASVLHDLRTLGTQRNLPSTMAAVARIQGVLDAAMGDSAAARASFEQSMREGRANALDLALAPLAFGSLLRRRGERRRARELLNAGLAAFGALQAEPFMARCRSELLASGSPDDATKTSGSSIVGELTPQERAVARLIGAGRTNREAADQLVLSVKTVGYHLGHVYAKLGVRSRSELAALLAHSELSGT